MKIATIGIDLAKEVFAIHGVGASGHTVLRKQIKRREMVKFFANLEPCLIGMKACGSAHHRARKLENSGHTVKLMAPQFVKPYVKRIAMTWLMQKQYVKRLVDLICGL